MPINGDVTITCNNQNVLTLCNIYDNNTPTTVEILRSIADLEAIHNTKATAHQNLFSAINTKDAQQDALIAQKANISAIPTKVSDLTNDSNYISDVSDKANVSLNNLSQTGITNLRNYLPQNNNEPFCANKGTVDSNGDANCLSYLNAILTIQSPIVITNAKGDSLTINSDKEFDVSDLSDGTYKVFANITNGALSLYSSTIYKQKTPPQSPANNDIWVNISVFPYQSKKYNGQSWEDFLDVPVGTCSVASNTITGVTSYKYNNNGIILKSKEISTLSLPSSRYTNLTPGSSGSRYTAPATGWFHFQMYGGSNMSVDFWNVTAGYEAQYNSFNKNLIQIFPVRKNDVVQIQYGDGSFANFRFFYAEGEQYS